MERTVITNAIDRPPLIDRDDTRAQVHVNNEANAAGVCWGAVFGGASVAAALSLILLALGAGLGLSSVSFWSNVGLSAAAIGTTAILWLIATEVISASIGGYLAGRLRTKWANIHNDEVYFRDTAHGFLAWSVALVISAAFLASAAASMVGGSVSAAGPSANPQADAANPSAYYVDTLFRTDNQKPADVDASMRTEAGRILVNGLRQGQLPSADRSYLAQLVSARTGLSQADADKRVSDVFSSAQAAAETTRKAVAHSLLWLFVALLIGAFCASLSATFGGAQRDHVVIV